MAPRSSLSNLRDSASPRCSQLCDHARGPREAALAEGDGDAAERWARSAASYDRLVGFQGQAKLDLARLLALGRRDEAASEAHARTTSFPPRATARGGPDPSATRRTRAYPPRSVVSNGCERLPGLDCPGREPGVGYLGGRADCVAARVGGDRGATSVSFGGCLRGRASSTTRSAFDRRDPGCRLGRARERHRSGELPRFDDTWTLPVIRRW